MKTKKTVIALIAVFLVALLNAAPLRAEESQEELAKKSLNPVADLISLPLQYNQDYGIGAADATKITLNIQPVVPVHITKDWNIIIRTIIPLIDAQSPNPGGESHSGFGDITQSFFFSPKEPVAGWIVGVGPVFLYPTGNPDVLSSEKWGIGPTFVVLKQEHGFTYGMLANHISSFAGNSGRQDVSSTFLQPFFGYTTKTYTTFMLNSESTYDWKTSQWTAPLNFMLTQMLKIKGQPISLQLGYRTYVSTPANGPNNGFRFQLTFLFPE